MSIFTTRFAALAAGTLALGTAVFVISNKETTHYQPREGVYVQQGIHGALAYLHSLRANQVTGEIDPSWILDAQAQADRLSAGKTASLEWESMGPDNGGGRTRAMLVDRDSSNVVYAGSVSGGLFKSRNGGATWRSMSDPTHNLAVVSICQTANGDLYYGTGEFPYIGYGGGGSSSTPSFIGGGIFKSSDRGRTWTRLASTVPSASTPGGEWTSVARMEAHPTNSSVVYAGTSGGFKRSADGGQTWTTTLSGMVRDMTISSSGELWAANNGKTMFSNDEGLTWVEKSTPTPGTTGLPRRTSRTRMAVSPQNNYIVYVAQLSGDALSAVYRSADKGATWTKIGQKSAQFDPMCTSGRCQGEYDFLFAVSPKDPNHIWLGGITVWDWQQTMGWRQVSTTSGFGGGANPFYLHSDNHEMVFDPKNPNTAYIGNDGGIFKSTDHGYTWTERNYDYRTYQFYAFGMGRDRKLIGGTQDNGTTYVDGRGNTAVAGKRLLINNAYADGGQADISWLRPKVMFAENQNGDLGRSDDDGESFQRFYSPIMTAAESRGYSLSNWIMPYKLWETTNDPGSIDSARFEVIKSIRSMGFGDGIKRVFKGKMSHPQSAAKFIAGGFKVFAGPYLMTADAQGNVTGDGTGKFYPDSAYFEITFNNPPLAEVILTCDVYIPAGSKVRMSSNIGGLPIPYTTATRLDVGNVVKVQDKIQSMFFVGLNSHVDAATSLKLGGIFMTRKVHDFSNTPEWWQVAHLPGKGEPLSMEISKDGNHLFVGTNGGFVFRISNLLAARKQAQAHIDSVSKNVLTVTQIANFNGRAVTGIAIDPANADRVAVSLGNYGNSTYVQFSTNALAASGVSFVPKQGSGASALPATPAYSITFDKANPNTVYVGTELGMYSCANISATPSWVEENEGLGRVPVFGIRQYRTDDLYDASAPGSQATEGELYIATHGRGFYKTGSTAVNRPVGLAERVANQSSKESLVVYPNPATNKVQVELNLSVPADVVLTLRDVTGRLVKQVRLGRLDASVDKVSLDLQGIRPGHHILTVQAGDRVTSSPLVIR
jgi:photosystem II stability/assembly factor-like uncharacterized protein